MKNKLVLLANLGSPNDLSENAVKEFLENMLSDPHLLKLPWYVRFFQRNLAHAIAKKRAKHSLELYKQAKGKSILLDITQAQAAKLEKKINIPVKIIMRHSQPRVQEISEYINKNEIEECTVLPMFPQYSTTTTKSSFQDIEHYLKKQHPSVQLNFIEDYHAHPLFIDAWLANIQRTLKHLNIQKSTVLLFSAHSLPESYLKQGDDRYLTQLQVSMSKIIEHLPEHYRSTLSFQSKFGKGKWLEPSTPEILNNLAPGTQVVLIPISFVSEHLETRYEMDIEFRAIAEQRGLIFRRVPSLNCSSIFIDCLAELSGY